MSRTSRVLVVAVALAAVLAAVLFPREAAAAAKYRWKVATLAPKGIGWSKQFEDIVLPAVDQGADGNLRLKVYWGGVLGDDEAYIRKMQVGQLHGAGLTAQGATLACPEFAVVELPFLFNGYDEVDYIRDRMQPTFDFYFGQYGFELMFWIDQDFDQAYSMVSPMASLDDFSRTTFVSWYGPLEEKLFEVLGARSVPLSVTDIPGALRSGRADSCITPAVWMVGTQLFTSMKYVNPTKIRYSPAAILVTTETWESIPEEYQDRLWAMRSDLQKKFVAGVRSDNQTSLNAIINYGVKEVKMDPGSFKAIQKKAMEVYGALAGDVYPESLLQELRRYLEAYRRGDIIEMPAEALVQVRPVSAPAARLSREAAAPKPEAEETEPADMVEPPAPVAEKAAARPA
ncbi:MAG: TRAP transporter substrate-binding protein DctP, partial [Pseudomonadota bacterium]